MVDLNYLKDSAGQKCVALSMVDAGTSWHTAVRLTTRQARYVNRNLNKHWIADYGVPERINCDQGGEFQKEFIGLLEEYSLPSRVTGAHAGYQLALGERHGGILGHMVMAVVHQHQVQGKKNM